MIDVVNQSDDSFAYNDDELRCVVVAEDPDNTSTPNISYSWRRNRDGSLDTIGDNTESLTLLPSDIRPSDEITCIAEIDSSSVEASILIENRELLETPTVFISPENPTSADVLTCSHSVVQDPDAQVVEMNYRWYKNQTIVQGAIESTFSDIVQNDVVSCDRIYRIPYRSSSLSKFQCRSYDRFFSSDCIQCSIQSFNTHNKYEYKCNI